MGSKEDINKYPVFYYVDRSLIRRKFVPSEWNIWRWQCHHYIPQNWIKNHKEQFKEIEHLQKLIFLPVRFIDKKGIEHNMHAELHGRHRNFEERYGIAIDKLLWNERSINE